MSAPITIQDIINRALFEIGAYSPSDAIPGEDYQFCKQKLVALIDAFNSDGLNVYGTDFLTYTLIPGIQPLLIGQAVVIIQASLTGNQATYIGANNYQVGDIVSTSGCATAALNVNDQVVISAVKNQFSTQIINADIPLEAETNAFAIFSTPQNEFPNFASPYPRPVYIDDANIVLNNVNPVVRCPVRIRDKDWWMANSVRNVPSTVPTDLYYDDHFPNGRINLWPAQTTTYQIELEVWQSLSDFNSLTDQFYMPQGYQDFVSYSLAEALCPTYGREMSPTGAKLLSKAVLRVQQLNTRAPKMATRDFGMPMGSRRGTVFNWLNGTVQPPRR